MKKITTILFFIAISIATLKAQNLISNPNFEQRLKSGQGCFNGQSISFSDSFTTIPFDGCIVKDWIRISETPDGFWYRGNNFPINYFSNHIFPHSDSVCVGGVFIGKTISNLREIIQGKLIKPLTTSHHYQFSMYVRLFDSLYWNDVGKIVGCNSFSAVFTDTAIVSVTDLPIQNYHPQVQIDSMVVDTQYWVLLVDTFIANGGEQFVSIGNFKTDAQTQTQLVKTVNSLPEVAYYFMDDVSLIDLDEVGIEEVGKNKMVIYPNPAKESIVVSCKSLVKTIEVMDLFGRVVFNQPIINSINQQIQINISSLPQGIYFIKATDINGNMSLGKFIKE